MVILGMMFFTLGAELSMTPMGENVGAKMTQSKNAIMKSIMNEAGIHTETRAIVFSLPVTDTAGMRLIDEIEMD